MSWVAKGFHMMGEISRKNPCKQDCPDRRGGCHASCEVYREYEAWKMNAYIERNRTRERTERSAGLESIVRRNERAKRANRKHER